MLPRVETSPCTIPYLQMSGQKKVPRLGRVGVTKLKYIIPELVYVNIRVSGMGLCTLQQQHIAATASSSKQLAHQVLEKTKGPC